MSNPSSDTADNSVRATFRFIQWSELYNHERPFQVLTQIPEDAEHQRSSNLVFLDDEVEIKDARKLEVPATLDTHGFMLSHSALPDTDFSDRSSVENSYFPEVTRLIKANVPDAEQVFIFDWRLRNTQPVSGPGTVLDFNDRAYYLRPAIHFHVDQSPAGVLNRVKMQLKDQAPTLLKKRVQLINVWRPLVDCIGDWPLAFCDGSTVDNNDFIETDHIRKHYQGSSMYMQRNPKQKFYYYSRQGKEDAVLIKIFDSKQDGVKAPYGPHAAFKLPHEEPDSQPRSSIEVRCLVFGSKDVSIPGNWYQQIRDGFHEGIDSVNDGEMYLQTAQPLEMTA